MVRFALFSLLITTLTVRGYPLKGNLNADAREHGNSTVIIDNDVILTPGKGGHNFNAKSDSKGRAIVDVGGKVRGSAVNRHGQEFNAESKDGGISQIRVTGDLELEGLDVNAQKFNALSESGGQSVVQVGNVQVISGARQARTVQIYKKPDRDNLGGGWGAVAVAEHNARPWEDLENGDIVVDSASQVNTPVSDLFQDEHDHHVTADNPSVPTGTEIHDFPHKEPVAGIVEIGPVVEVPEKTTSTPVVKPILLEPSADNGDGNMNAISKGFGSNSFVKVVGSVKI